MESKKFNKKIEIENNTEFDIGIIELHTTIRSYKEVFKNRFNELLQKSIEEGHQQKEITEKTGISAASITQYKNGTTVPKGAVLESLASYFNVSTNYLLGKSDTPIYSFEDINNKTGLSQKAIETLYRLQHNCFEKDIDLTKNTKKSNVYSSQLSILNLLIEDSEKLIELLNNIKEYKELCKQANLKTKEDKEKMNFFEYKLTKDFIEFLSRI